MPRAATLHPILGFRWAGWTAAAILACLIAATLAGVDLQFQLLRAINAAGGDGAVQWFLGWMAFQWIAMRSSDFGLAAAIALAGALWIAPRPRWNWDLIAIVLLGLALPKASILAQSAVFQHLHGGPVTSPRQIADQMLLATWACLAESLLLAAILIAATRSRLVTIGVLAYTAVATAQAYAAVRFVQMKPLGIWEAAGIIPPMSLVPALVLAPTLCNSIMRRRRCVRILRQSQSSMCPECGYDLAGLREPRCPECNTTTRNTSRAPPMGSDSPRHQYEA